MAFLRVLRFRKPTRPSVESVSVPDPLQAAKLAKQQEEVVAALRRKELLMQSVNDKNVAREKLAEALKRCK